MKSFSSSKLHPIVVKNLEEKNILVPTDIQKEAIPTLLKHEGDFVGKAATGTGKTIAFLAPLITKIDISKGILQAVILVPTRELSEQIGNELAQLVSGIEGLKTKAIYGGVSVKSQIHDLSNGVQIVVATPGRLIDLIGRNVVNVSSLKYVIFDEADEMLLKGFKTDIDKILDRTDRKYASWLFSATMPGDINNIIRKYLHHDLKRIYIDDNEQNKPKIKHEYIQVEAEDKLNVLLHFLNSYSGKKGIVFCRTKSGVQKLYKQLSANKFSSGALHGDLPQGLRNKVVDQFKNNHINILLATDVAARGLDIDQVEFIIQYHLADTADSYTHRSGRTARKGNVGNSLTFIFPEEKEKLDYLKDKLNIEFNNVESPSYKDQQINKAFLWAKKIAKEKALSDVVTSEEKQLFNKELEHLSKAELFEKMMAWYLRDQQS
jgi:ATP-dependent RNA helicase DeaD